MSSSESFLSKFSPKGLKVYEPRHYFGVQENVYHLQVRKPDRFIHWLPALVKDQASPWPVERKVLEDTTGARHTEHFREPWKSLTPSTG